MRTPTFLSVNLPAGSNFERLKNWKATELMDSDNQTTRLRRKAFFLLLWLAIT